MNTFEITITLPEVIAITSRGQSVELALKAMKPELIAQGTIHGFTQKVADAAAGAKKAADEDESGGTVEEHTVAMMEAVVEQLEAGDWGRTRSGGGGLSERDAVARIVVGGWFRDTYAKGTPERDEYNSADAAGRYAIIDKIWQDNEKAFAKAVDLEIAARKEAAERKAAIGGVTVNI